MKRPRHKRSFEEELAAIERWRAKAQGVAAADWNGKILRVRRPHGIETFNRHAVEVVIFANF